MNFTPENITSLEPNQVFVFGSNDQGVHGAGAAKLAREFGARHGDAYGKTGNCYAICTRFYDYEKAKSFNKDARRYNFGKCLSNCPLGDIQKEVEKLHYWAMTNTHLHFLVTKIGCGLAGYAEQEIAPLFAGFEKLNNVSLPESFYKIITECQELT